MMNEKSLRSGWGAISLVRRLMVRGARLWVAMAIGTLLWASVATAAAPVRLILQPAQVRAGETEAREALFRGRLVLMLYLQDWLSQEPAVRVMDGPQGGAVLDVALGAARVPGADAAFAAITAVLAADAVITVEADKGQVVCLLHRADGVTRLASDYAGAADAPKLLRAVTAFLVKELQLDAARAWIGREVPDDSGALLEDAAVARVLWAPWIDNSGEARLGQLMPHLKRMPQDPFTAAAVADAATWLSFDGRVVKEPTRLVRLAMQAVVCLLGTAREETAVFFCRHNRIMPEIVEKELLAILADTGVDELDAVLAGRGDGSALLEGGAGPSLDGVTAVLAGKKSVAQQAGAIRCLGAMKSAAALPHLARITRLPDPVLRAAAAEAFTEYGGETGLETLRALVRDPETAVAFEAAHSLWRRGHAPADALELARREWAARPNGLKALALLARTGGADDVARLRQTADDVSPERRLLAAEGLLRLDAMADEQLVAWLADPATAVVRSVLKHLPAAHVPRFREELVRVANHPHDPLAEAARLALRPLLPKEPEARARFELTCEHPYVRRQHVERWAAAGGAAALDALDLAARNNQPHTRALALLRLSEHAPDRARAHLAAGLADAHRFVRLYAAAAAARAATPADRALLEQALAAQTDEATRLYLQETLTRLAGGTPSLRPGVHIVPNDRNMSFNCGFTDEADRSPFDGFYVLNTPTPDQVVAMRRAHAKGKVFLLRANQTAKNPAQVFLNAGWRDGFWLGLDAEFSGMWDAMDGVVLGEESMYFRPYNEWENGWRLFCREAGVDPQRIAGDREKLSELEQRLWWDWEQRVAIEGFNAMTDYIKLRYGKLRPGFQVATFMPDQNGPCAYDRIWRFDIAAGYNYAAPSRVRYDTIRRMKTVWPERPVLWLNQGKVGVGLGLNLVSIQHSTKVPSSPLHAPTDISVADALCTWLAGGHTGLFSIYLFVHVGWKGEDFGRWVTLDDITPTSPVLAGALEHSFRGLGEKYRVADGIKDAKPSVELSGDDLLSDFEKKLDKADGKKDPYLEREAKEKEDFRRGFLLERRLIQDSVNLFSGVPFPPQRRDALLIGGHAPAAALVTGYDTLQDLVIAAQAPLDGYRFIGVTGQGEALLTDAAVAAVTAWLRAQPGLLYVHGWLSDDPARKAVTLADAAPLRQAAWPWKGAVEPVTGTRKIRGRDTTVTEGYRVSGGDAVVLHEAEGKALLVFWRGPGMKGGVVFDAGQLSPTALHPLMGRLFSEKGVGLEPAAPIGILGHAETAYAAWSSTSDATAALKLSGVDALSGIRNPELRPGRAGVLAARDWCGNFAAAAGGVTVLSDQRLDACESLADGLAVETEGLFQAVSAGGDLQVVADGKPLPAIAADDLLAWMYSSVEPGIAVLTREEPLPGHITFIRAKGRVTVTRTDK